MKTRQSGSVAIMALRFLWTLELNYVPIRSTPEITPWRASTVFPVMLAALLAHRRKVRLLVLMSIVGSPRLCFPVSVLPNCMVFGTEHLGITPPMRPSMKPISVVPGKLSTLLRLAATIRPIPARLIILVIMSVKPLMIMTVEVFELLSRRPSLCGAHTGPAPMMARLVCRTLNSVIGHRR